MSMKLESSPFVYSELKDGVGTMGGGGGKVAVRAGRRKILLFSVLCTLNLSSPIQPSTIKVARKRPLQR